MDYNHLAEDFIQLIKGKSQSGFWSKFQTYTRGEHQVLFYLYKNSGKPILPSDIAKFTDTSTARIATILNNLEEKNMVTREISRKDRRKILVSITGCGREVADEQRRQALNRIASILEEMGKEQAESFVKNFQAFLEIGSKLAQNEENKEKEEPNV